LNVYEITCIYMNVNMLEIPYGLLYVKYELIPQELWLPRHIGQLTKTHVQ
jgi:hypothetical protein